MNKERLGNFIGGERRSLGLTQKDLAARLHVTDKAVSKWERGMSYPDVTLLEPLAAVLDLTVEELMACRRQAVKGEEETMQNLLDISRDSVRKERRRSWQRLAAVLMLLAVTAAVVAWTQIMVTEDVRDTLVLMETVDSVDYVYIEGEEGHLLKLRYEGGVKDLQVENEWGEPQVFQISYRYNRLTHEGTVTALEGTGSFSMGGIMDAQYDEGEGPMFGLPMVYRMSENYFPNPYGEGYLGDYTCYVMLDEETWETADILRIKDCVSATPWDADGDGIDELVVRTRWPEKPYAVYDIPEGELKPQLVSWSDTVPEEIRENLTCIWEQ
ncbi:helix-turn-helix domain-containing protein [Oscillibacter valericigenes]|uniref:helix-turn-helix domain-containing protein n=1 Tax=Oscillibacter valericigenes TaxID=351091 RepID=UPI0019593A7D|nr:helix-turn-helix transcriptional regulator [Oscillibacter valericigenes]